MSSRGPKDKWGQVNARLPVELFLFFTFGHEACATTGRGCEASVGRKLCDKRRVNVIRAASQVKDDIDASSVRLRPRLDDA